MSAVVAIPLFAALYAYFTRNQMEDLMANAKSFHLLFMSKNVMANMPPAAASNFLERLASFGITGIEVGSDTDSVSAVEEAHRHNNHIVGFIGHSDSDIPGLKACTKYGGMAITLDGGSASVWCAREEGRSIPFGRCANIRQPSDSFHALQSAVGGF